MHRGNLHSARRWLRQDHNATKLLLAMLVLTSLACNAFAGSYEPLPEPPQISERPTDTAETPAMAATATLTGDISESEASVSMLVDLNVRSGPGVQYERVGFLPEGTTIPIIGVETQSGWWQVPCPASIGGDQCWVSGGSQYVSASDTEGVPTAEAPATPTTSPPVIEPGRGWIAYLDNDQLHVSGLDLNQGLPALTSTGLPLSAGETVQRFAFSPDGRRLAYVSGAVEANTLNIVNVDGGDQRTLVTSTDLPIEQDQNAGQQTFLIDTIQWLPDGNGVAFNTAITYPAGPGAGSREDLWLVDLDGDLKELFPAGEGGGRFLIQPGGQVLLTAHDHINRAALDGGRQETVLVYDPINTASEYIYYPQPQDTAAGTYVALPAADPWAPGAETTLWRLSGDGPAAEMGRVAGVDLGHSIVWSSDGQQIAAVQQADTNDQFLFRLVIAAADGTGAIPYAGGSNLAFLAWSPADDQFLYGGKGYYAQGRQQAPQQQNLLTSGLTAAQATWLDGSKYIISLNDPENQQWQIHGANTTGESTSLLTGQGTQSAFEIWTP